MSTLEGGPVRARLLVESTYEWPSLAIGDERSCSQRSDDMTAVDVRTTLELRALTVGQSYWVAIESFDENGVSILSPAVPIH